MESSLNIRDSAFNIENHAIGMRCRHGKPVGLCERDDGLVILFRRAEQLSELLRCQIVTEIGAGRVVNLFQQRVERFLVAQRQPDGQLQALRAGLAVHQLQIQILHGLWYVTAEGLSSHRLGLVRCAGRTVKIRICRQSEEHCQGQ